MHTTGHDDSQIHDLMHYPTDHLVGILKSGAEAEQAALSLHDAGFSDVVVLDGPPALEAAEARERAANLLARARSRLEAYLSDDGDSRRSLLEALGRRRAIVLVHVSGEMREDQAERILEAHGARAIRYLGRWSITVFGR